MGTIEPAVLLVGHVLKWFYLCWRRSNRAGPRKPPLKGQCMTGQLKHETDLNGGALDSSWLFAISTLPPAHFRSHVPDLCGWRVHFAMGQETSGLEKRLTVRKVAVRAALTRMDAKPLRS